ncbi:hypothetical protein PR048_006870 [Dryococelus australis]|uniref:BTB domain-containing protein n=1 Tax=Dryococelus australis TaxID=614101 RepID=A0ABQ9IC50_9NEOP|nr:hypothetical protein PR048_006870 [Dryococelus australis]
MAVVADSSVVEILCEVHFAHLTSALKELAISGVLTDITFVCEDGTLQAHQVVVSAFSGSLRQISSSSGHKSCVFIINAKKKIVQALLHFLYQGYTCISKHEFEALTEAASTLKLDCFTQTQLEYVDDNLYLRFPDHERLLRENLQCLRSSHNLCDVVFVTEELSRVYSHACIMATCSRMLQSVLMSHRRNNDGPCVLVLEGVKLEHILPILDFCYHGSASMTQEIVCETHCVARLMEMDYICEILATVDDPLSITTNVSSPKSQVTNTVRLMDMISEPGNGRDSFRNFQRILSHLASTESLTDVTFLKDGRCLRAHSVLLCAFGPYFKELEEKLGHDLKEAVVLVRSLSGSLLQSYLDYLYRGEAQFSGSPKEFCELMSNWIDFSLLPADDSTLLPCDGKPY